MNDQAVTSPPIVPERDFSSLLALVDLLADPVAVRERVAALAKHQTLLKDVADALDEARAQHAAALHEVRTGKLTAERRLAEQEAASNAKMDDRSRALDGREAKLGQREVRLADAEAKAANEREAVQALRADLERRVDAVKIAASK